MFCPKCGSMLRPKVVRDKKVLACSCGYAADKAENKVTFNVTQEDTSPKIDVVEKESLAYPIVDEECPKCKHDKAYTWHQQMRAGDEPETHFLKCVKCGHTWREGK